MTGDGITPTLETDRFLVEALTAADAEDIVTWRYPEPYSMYDIGCEAATFTDAANRYFGVRRGPDLWGYCCFGAEARVPGDGDEGVEPQILDIGAGMHPGFVGSGHGADFMRSILGFATGTHSALRFRVAIAEWNERAARTVRQLGFHQTRRFTKQGTDVVFRQYERAVDRA